MPVILRECKTEKEENYRDGEEGLRITIIDI